MRRGIRDLLRITQFPVIIACGTLPIPIILFGYLAPELLSYAWILPMAYLILTVISFFIPGKLRAAYGIVVGIGLVLPWILSVRGQPLVVSLIAAVIFAALLFWSTRIGGWSSHQELHSAWVGACIGLQLAGQTVYYLDSLMEVTALTSQAVWFSVSFMVFFSDGI